MQTEMCLLDVDYILVEGKPVIRLWGKTKDGKIMVVFDHRFRPYFYIEPKEDLNEDQITELKKRIMGLEIDGKSPIMVEEVKRSILGKQKMFLKVVVTVPANVPKFRKLVKGLDDVKQQYEYGISFHKRYLIDNDLVPMDWILVSGKAVNTDLKTDISIKAEDIKPLSNKVEISLNMLAFDIEVIQEDSSEKIIMISVMDSNGFKKVIVLGKKGKCAIRNLIWVRDEKALIKKFIDLVMDRDPDIIVTFNGDRYDFVKLNEKAAENKIRLNLGRDNTQVIFKKRGRVSAAQIKGRVHVDLFDFIEHILSASLSTEVLTLDRVAKELIGAGKKTLKWKDIEHAWKIKDLGIVTKYCLHDSELTLNLSKYLLPQIFELCKITSQTLFDASRMTYSQLVEWLLIKNAFKWGEIIPNRPKYDEVMRRRKATPYTGGYVHLPKKGIHDSIALFDFQSLYPTIIITYNISPETLECDCCRKKGAHRVPDEPHYYCSKHKGFIPNVIEGLLKSRIDIKKRMKGLKHKSILYKSLNNRQYALKVLANASYGYYSYAGSRWYSRVCAESITSWGRYYIKKVIGMAERSGYDVIYGDTDSLFIKVKSKKQANEFLENVNHSLPSIIELEFKNMYKSGIFVLGKTGIAAKKRYALIDYKGNIVIRGFEKVRRDWANIARETQEMVLEAVLKDHSPEKAINIVKERIKNLQKEKVKIDDLIIYSQITRPLSEYEQVGPHVSAARKAVERGKIIKEGYTIGYVITKGSGSISLRAEPAEDAKNYDPDYYIHHQVIPAAIRVLGCLGYTEEDIIKTKKQYDLRGFLKKL
jgi:DNA polymerase I/DNA polymerase-2